MLSIAPLKQAVKKLFLFRCTLKQIKEKKNFIYTVTNLVSIYSLGCVPVLAIVSEKHNLSYVLKSWRTREIQRSTIPLSNRNRVSCNSFGRI